jgi:hypothetical protein
MAFTYKKVDVGSFYRMYVLSESNTECEFCETDHEYDVIRVRN